MKLEINVNQLATMIAKEWGYESVSIESADFANSATQHNPEGRLIGAGGVLTLHIEATAK